MRAYMIYMLYIGFAATSTHRLLVAKTAVDIDSHHVPCLLVHNIDPQSNQNQMMTLHCLFAV